LIQTLFALKFAQRRANHSKITIVNYTLGNHFHREPRDRRVAWRAVGRGRAPSWLAGSSPVDESDVRTLDWTLRPNYLRVWFDVVLCITLMVLGFAAHLFVTHRFGILPGFESGILFSLWIGFWLQSLLTFGHQAAHYNLAEDRSRNDILSDWTVWLFFPQSTRPTVGVTGSITCI